MESSGLGIDAGDVRPFVIIACEACPAEIASSIRAAVLTRDDMVDVEEEAVVHLRDPAVLAAAVGSLFYQFFGRAVHAWLARPGGSVGSTASLERAAGLRLHDVDDVADSLVIVDLGLLLG